MHWQSAILVLAVALAVLAPRPAYSEPASCGISCDQTDGSSQCQVQCSTTGERPTAQCVCVDTNTAVCSCVPAHNTTVSNNVANLKSGWAKVLPVALELASALTQAFLDELDSGSFSVSQPASGTWWITAVDGKWGSWKGQVVSCFYHPTCTHSSTTVGKLGTKKSQASAGHWAISYQSKAFWGNKAYYDTQC